MKIGPASKVVSDGSSATLPPGWCESTDESGSIFFYNEELGISTWDRPVHDEHRQCEEPHLSTTNLLAFDLSAQQRAERSGAGEDAEPSSSCSAAHAHYEPDTLGRDLAGQDPQGSRSLLVFASAGDELSEMDVVAGLFCDSGTRTVRQLGDQYFLVTFASRPQASEAFRRVASEPIPCEQQREDSAISWTPAARGAFVRFVSEEDLAQPLFDSAGTTFEDPTDSPSRDLQGEDALSTPPIAPKSISKRKGDPKNRKKFSTIKDPKMRAQIKKWQSVA